ncbi:unnamed protein product [Cylicocyclus nassatus]|uniref:Sulfotransferase family protein n=1 Tax=Cylicocyclus nassatus TaxID=53992 RepID=A0AA36DJH2_CYLNA|nr:unnamed protein product [Cylicocyclus nassatus]
MSKIACFDVQFCGCQNRHLGYDELNDIVGKSRVQFVTVRHPMQRFLSGFVDKCIRVAELEKKLCLKCNGNLICFIEKLYSYLNDVHAINKAFKGYNYDLAHFAPQNWYCDFYNHFEDYIIIRQGENREEIMEHTQKLEMILRSANVPDRYRKEINRELLTNLRNCEICGDSAAHGFTTYLKGLTRLADKFGN